MKKKIIYLTAIISIMMFVSSCQDDNSETTILPDKDTRTVAVKLDMNVTPFGIETGYEPMNRASDGKIVMSNTFKYIIAQRMEDDRLIVERTAYGKINPNVSSIDIQIPESSSPYPSLELEIRPGNYEIYIFTGDGVLNTSIKPGDLLDENENAPWAVRYSIGSSSSYVSYLEMFSQRETFYGRKEFTVTKTNDLHSSPATLPIEVNMERRVAKLRILLYDITVNKSSFDNLGGSSGLIITKFKEKNGNLLPIGLDIWGNVYYDKIGEFEPHYQHQYGAQFKAASIQGTDLNNYYIPMMFDREFSIYMLTDPNTSFDIENSIPIKVNRVSGAGNALFEGTVNLTLRNNTISGIVLKLDGRESNNNGYIMYMEEVYGDDNINLLDPAGLFSGNYEYP